MMDRQPEVFTSDDPGRREDELIEEAAIEAGAEPPIDIDLSLPDDPTDNASLLDRLRKRVMDNVDSMPMADVVRVYTTTARLEEARLMAESKKKAPLSTDLKQLRAAAREAMLSEGGRVDDSDE